MSDRYVVKVRRYYEGREATSVVHWPTDYTSAMMKLIELQAAYQDKDTYYLEKWSDK